MERSTLPIALLAWAIVLGQVRDETTHQPLPNVLVAIGAKHATTDAGGRFAIRGVADGARTVTVRSDDVPAQRFRIEVRSPSTRSDLRVCSTTLDYSCAGPAPFSGNG